MNKSILKFKQLILRFYQGFRFHFIDYVMWLHQTFKTCRPMSLQGDIGLFCQEQTIWSVYSVQECVSYNIIKMQPQIWISNERNSQPLYEFYNACLLNILVPYCFKTLSADVHSLHICLLFICDCSNRVTITRLQAAVLAAVLFCKYSSSLVSETFLLGSKTLREKTASSLRKPRQNIQKY